MTFQFIVYYEDDSRCNYGKVKTKVIRARNKANAAEKFLTKYGIRPIKIV